MEEGRGTMNDGLRGCSFRYQGLHGWRYSTVTVPQTKVHVLYMVQMYMRYGTKRRVRQRFLMKAAGPVPCWAAE